MSRSSSDRRRLLAPAGRTLGPPEGFAAPDSVWPHVLFVLLAMLVVYLPNQAQVRIETGLRGLNVVNILVILAFWVTLLCQHPKSEPMPMKRPLVALILSFTCALLVALVGDATAWVEDVTVYKNMLFYPMLYVLFFFAVRDLRTLRWLLALTILIFFTSSVLGIRQALDYGMGAFQDHKRVAAPFGWDIFDANRSAIFFCIHLQFIGAAALFLKSRPGLRLFCAVLYGMGVFVVFFTYSRQALFILAFLGLILLARKQLLLTLAFLLALYNYEMWVPDSVVERVEMTTPDPFDFETPKVNTVVWDPFVSLEKPFVPEARGKQIGHDETQTAATSHSFDVSTESRFTLWAGAFELIKRKPWGVGLNRFKREIGAYVPLGLAGKDAHNVFVLFTTEAGLLAPLVLLAILATCIKLGLDIARLQRDDEARTLGNGLVLATLAVALGNLYGSRFFDGDVMGNYWIALALCARFLMIKRGEIRRRESGSGSAAPPRGGYLGPRTMAMTPPTPPRQT